jgi:hypothetical protein
MNELVVLTLFWAGSAILNTAIIVFLCRTNRISRRQFDKGFKAALIFFGWILAPGGTTVGFVLLLAIGLFWILDNGNEMLSKPKDSLNKWFVDLICGKEKDESSRI